MAKPFNQLLHDDINLLHGIDKVKFPGEYRRAFENIMKRYNISRSTVYTELEKAVPGEYKTTEGRGRHIIITPKEIETVRGMLAEGKTLRQITKSMSLGLGFRYTPYRIYKVKELIATGKYTGGTEPLIEAVASVFSSHLLEEGNIPPVTVEEEPINFKGNIRRLFNRLSMIDLISVRRPVKINIAGNIIQVSGRAIKNCFGYMIYSAMHEGKDIPSSCRFEMELILINELEQIRRGSTVSPAALRQIESIRRSLHAPAAAPGAGTAAAAAALKGGYDLDDIFRAVTHFAPGTTREDMEKLFGG